TTTHGFLQNAHAGEVRTHVDSGASPPIRAGACGDTDPHFPARQRNVPAHVLKKHPCGSRDAAGVTVRNVARAAEGCQETWLPAPLPQASSPSYTSEFPRIYRRCGHAPLCRRELLISALEFTPASPTVLT